MMSTITIKISGMHCPSCSMLLEMGLGELPGVDSARVHHAAGVATVCFDPADIDLERIIEEIRSAGYEAEIEA